MTGIDASAVRQAEGAGETTARDTVFTFSFETYTDAVARGMMRPPDRILSTLLASPRVDRLLVANPSRWLPTHAARTVLRRNAAFPTTEKHALHTPLRLRKADATGADDARVAYRAYGASVQRAAARLGLRDPAFITTHPLIAGLMPHDWTTGRMFFARDDWSSHPGYRAYWPAFDAAYRAISESGMPVTAVSQQILDRIEPTGPSAVVPNGVEPPEWAGERPAEPAWMADIPHPRALYVGTLDSRLDIEGIVDWASRRPDIHTILMGPQPEPEYIAPLRGLANVHVRGNVERAELVATMRNVDLCLLSHRRTPLTEAMSPLKVYEYLAAGCPVISIDLPPVHGIDERVLIVDSVADFADVAQQALDLGPAPEEERWRFVTENSWTSRHRLILDMTFGA